MRKRLVSLFLMSLVGLTACGSDSNDAQNTMVPDAGVEPDEGMQEPVVTGPSRFAVGSSGAHIADGAVRMRVAVGAPMAQSSVQAGNIRMTVGVGPVIESRVSGGEQ